MESVSLRGIVHAADHFREELAVQIRKENAQRLGFAGDEAARAAVRDVAHLAGDFTNEAPGLFADGSAAVENTRDGGDGHVCFTSDIPDRDHDPRDWARAGIHCKAAD